MLPPSCFLFGARPSAGYPGHKMVDMYSCSNQFTAAALHTVIMTCHQGSELRFHQ